MPRSDEIWPEEKISELRRLWAEGHSTAEIGRRLLSTKNAIVGKAHRLELDARPSPIRWGGAPKVVAPVAPKRTLPALGSLFQAVVVVPREIAAPLPPMPAVRLPVPAKPVIAAPARAEAPQPLRRSTECCWPIGEPRTKAFRFCGGAAVLGKPYCEGHCRDGYTKVRDRDREQAA